MYHYNERYAHNVFINAKTFAYRLKTDKNTQSAFSTILNAGQYK